MSKNEPAAKGFLVLATGILGFLAMALVAPRVFGLALALLVVGVAVVAGLRAVRKRANASFTTYNDWNDPGA